MEFVIFQPKWFWFPQNQMQRDWLNFMPQMWPSGLTLTMTLTLDFQGKISNFLYLSQKWFNCYETQTLGFKCSHQFWPWSWPWLWIFKIILLDSRISGMAGLIDLKREGSKSIGCWGKNATLTFDHMHVFDHGFSRSSFEIAISRELEGRYTLNKREMSRYFMTMTVTFSWPRWSVRIYRIMAGVASDVAVPYTRII